MVFGDPLFLISSRGGGGNRDCSTKFRRRSGLGLFGLGEVSKEGDVGTAPDNGEDDEIGCPPEEGEVLSR